MICENCQTTQASYELKISFNQGQSQISLCTECYEIAKQKLEKIPLILITNCSIKWTQMAASLSKMSM